MIDLSPLGKKAGPIPFEYTWKDVVRYALSVGARVDELPCMYENTKGGFYLIQSLTDRGMVLSHAYATVEQ
jgi:hypothetical protein